MGITLSNTSIELNKQALAFHQEFAEFHKLLGPEAHETAQEQAQISNSISIALESVQLAMKRQQSQHL